jgi:hypothetical protein
LAACSGAMDSSGCYVRMILASSAHHLPFQPGRLFVGAEHLVGSVGYLQDLVNGDPSPVIRSSECSPCRPADSADFMAMAFPPILAISSAHAVSPPQLSNVL